MGQKAFATARVVIEPRKDEPKKDDYSRSA